ncbi:MAG: hypothetical protein WD771_09310 [Gemmatimonadaceae bacterium]
MTRPVTWRRIRALLGAGRILPLAFAVACDQPTGTSGPPPTISLSVAALVFTGVADGVSPASQVVTITNTGGSTLEWVATANQAWVGLAPASGSGTSLTVSANTTGLTAGTYNAAVAISSSTATNSPQVVNVTLTVEPPSTIGVSTTAMTFSGMVGAASPAAQELAISNTGGGTLNWTAGDDQAWLSLSAGSGSAPSNVTVTANTTGLAAGTYTGTITIAAPGATNTPRTVTVTLNVTPDLSGTWVGTSSQDSTVRITVVDNAVTQIYLGFRIPACGVTGNTTTTFNTPFSIASGTINRTVSGSPLGWTITGTFIGGTSASGNLTFNWSLSGCSSTVNLTWTAVKT